MGLATGMKKGRTPSSTSTPEKRDYVATAKIYARQVVDGSIPNCKLTIAACQRFLDDLERTGWEYVLDAKKATRVCRFIELLPHVKGDWAKRREKIRLEAWQVFLLVNVFGWVHRVTRLRRFRLVYAEVPRKNAKSTLAAGIADYLGVADEEMGAEVYCGATTKEQAWKVFGPARLMVERTPDLKKAFGCDALAQVVYQAETDSIVKPMVGKPGDGDNPSGAIVDEYHEHADSTQFDAMQTGMGSRSQPLMFVITTAGGDLEGPCYQLHLRARDLLNKVQDDDRFFALIYSIDDDDDWTSEDVLRKANPNADVSVFMDYLRAEQQAAVRHQNKSGTFKTKHLNVWIAARFPFFNIVEWRKRQQKFAIEDFRAQECIAHLDLASKKDLASMCLSFRRKGVLYYLSRYYLPRTRVLEVKAVDYTKWEEQGWLTVTEGNVLDFEYIKRDLRELRDLVEFKHVLFDPFQAAQLSVEMGNEGGEGFPMEQYGMTVKNFSEPMKEVDKRCLDGKLVHDGNPITLWCMSNVVAREDAKENVFPVKENLEQKIDGAVSIIACTGKWMSMPEEEEQGWVAL